MPGFLNDVIWSEKVVEVSFWWHVMWPSPVDGAALAGPPAPHCGVQQVSPFACTRHDQGLMPLLEGPGWNSCAKGLRFTRHPYLLHFVILSLPSWITGLSPRWPPMILDHMVGGITHLFIWTPSNLHSVINDQLMNNCVLRILTGSLLSCYITV